MNSFAIGALIAVVVFGGAVLGMSTGRRLPPRHVDADTRAVVSVSMAVLGTMSALVIGFLISNANVSLRTQNLGIAGQSAEIMRVDRLLRRYGPDAEPARQALRTYTAARVAELTRHGSAPAPAPDPASVDGALEQTQDLILSLRPGDDRQRWLQGRALTVTTEISAASAELAAQNTSAIPLPFLFLVVFWLAILFGSFGLFAPRHATAFVVFLLCALAVAAAIKVLLDMDNPFGGHVRLSGFPIRITTEPMRRALEAIGR